MRRILASLALTLCFLTPAQARAPSVATSHMVAAANPAASEAGLAMLRAGGSALDAAVAVQAVLGLVEPQSSGLGGGAFLLHWDATARTLASYDGRETAPAAATPSLFLKPDGSPMAFYEAVLGGRSVGVPGAIPMLAMAHARHGRLSWSDLFAPAIRLAEQGFPVSPRLSALIAAEGERLKRDPAASAYFHLPDGSPLPPGHVLRNAAYADTLRRIAAAGPAALLQGEIARDIVGAIRGAEANPGAMTEADLAAYRPIEREPVCSAYRSYRVCGMAPPSSGGIAVGQILGLLGHFDLASLSPTSPDAAHLLLEATRLAFADRGLYVADPDQVAVPTRGLLDPAYLTTRAQLLDRDRAAAAVKPGNPPWTRAAVAAPQPDETEVGTSHVSIVDRNGHAVSMTTTIEDAFGSRLMVRGFLLNNELTDFSFRPEVDGRPVANRVGPGKRPRSSMAPSLIFGPDGRLVLVAGSPGGARIISYTAQAIVAVLDWGLDPQAAVELPRVVTIGGPAELEEGTEAATLKDALEARGHRVMVRSLESGLHLIAIGPDGRLQGGADPRREGVGLGE